MTGGIDRDDLRRWLELGHAPFTICRDENAIATLIRLQKAPSVDYLYQIAMGSDNSVFWNRCLILYSSQSLRGFSQFWPTSFWVSSIIHSLPGLNM